MTDMSTTTTATGDAGTIVDTALAAAEPKPLDEDGRLFSVIVPPSGHHVVVDVEDYLDDHRDRPRRKTGAVTVHDAASFVTYIAKHGLPETELWADVTDLTVVGVVNAHAAAAESTDDLGHGAAGWGDHRVHLDLKTTPPWAAWSKYDGKMLEQADFAEHVETRLPDFVAPSAAEMLELAQSIQATRSVAFESSRRLKSGETTLEYREDVQASAGKGTIAIPDAFELALKPFEGAETYRVTARFRYRLRGQQLLLGYVLDRPEDVLRAAFGDILAVIDEGTTVPILRGTPS